MYVFSWLHYGLLPIQKILPNFSYTYLFFIDKLVIKLKFDALSTL